MKAGTTWTQGIVANLLWPDGDLPAVLGELSPWLDSRFDPTEQVLGRLEGQTHRRFIKTHTAADGIPLFEETRYLVVGRDGRDVFMSMVNHWKNMRHGAIKLLNESSAGEAEPFPIYDDDLHGFFDSFISRGSFPWEGDGAPWWSHFSHAASWWPLRGESNVLFLHYNDLLTDLEGEARRVAAFCGIAVPEPAWPAIVERCSLEGMRDSAGRSEAYDQLFRGGAQSFFYKGSNGRWTDVLTAAELARYDERVKAVLPPDAAAWLEHGRLAGGRLPSSDQLDQ